MYDDIADDYSRKITLQWSIDGSSSLSEGDVAPHDEDVEQGTDAGIQEEEAEVTQMNSVFTACPTVTGQHSIG